MPKIYFKVNYPFKVFSAQQG